MTTKSDQFLYSGYTFAQKQSFLETREVLRIRGGTKRNNPVRCEKCGKGGMLWRATTRTYKCRDPNCRNVQQGPPRSYL